YHDGAEANRAGLHDRITRGLVVIALRLDGEVDHHDRVLLHQPYQHDDADEGVETELRAEDDQREECTKAREGQPRENREWMDEALVENAEHDVDHHHGEYEQHEQSALRLLECLCGTAELRADGGRQRLTRGVL